MKRWLFISIVIIGFVDSVQAVPHQCTPDAIIQAQRLLAFHTEGDERAVVEPTVKQRPSITNPENAKQEFVVLELFGNVYKGRYRIRLIYYPLGNECVLMGQEILELANL